MNLAVKPRASQADNRPDHISEAEWRVRTDLAAFYRLVHHYGMSMLVYNHITARVPGPDHHFLINEYGLSYEEITASNLVKVDLDGNVVDGSGREINPAGYIIHSCVHRARKDLTCVAHTHSRAGVAVSCLKEGLIPMNQEGLQFHKRIAYHDYEGVALRLEERERLVASLGNREAMVLRNHGLLTTGATIAECFNNMYRLERACQLQVMALSCNTELQLPPQEVTQYTNNLMLPGVRRRFGLLEWPAMLRKLDRTDPSYRD